MEDTYYNRSFYRGYTPKQLDAMIEQDQVRQQIMLNAEPITITPPALFTEEMLEQIRAVMREEFNRTYQDTAYWEKLTEEQKNAVNEWRSLTGQMLAAKAAQFHRKHPELHILFDFRSDVVIKEARDTSADEQEAFLKGQRQAI